MLHAGPDAAQVDRADAVEVLGRLVGGVAERKHDAGVVEGHVEAAVLGDGAVDERGDLILVGDVARDAERAVTEVGQLVGGRAQRLLVDIGEHDRGARCGESAGSVKPHPGAGAGAGDKGDLAGEVVGRVHADRPPAYCSSVTCSPRVTGLPLKRFAAAPLPVVPARLEDRLAGEPVGGPRLAVAATAAASSPRTGVSARRCGRASRVTTRARTSRMQAAVNDAETRSARRWRPCSPAPAASKTVMRMPSPRAPPRWWATLTRAPAMPASGGATPAIPAVVSVLRPSPWPIPKTSIGSATPST